MMQLTSKHNHIMHLCSNVWLFPHVSIHRRIMHLRILTLKKQPVFQSVSVQSYHVVPDVFYMSSRRWPA